MTDIPNAILQMAYNKLYVPLSMLTTSALSKIQMNNNLKFRKIPFGNGIGKQSLDESSFPLEDLLTETYFFQAYRNWLMVIDIIATPDVAIGWYEHHSRMLRDDKLNDFFDALWDIDKQLHSQFITHPFQIDPYSATYIQLLERSCMESFFSHAEKAQQMFDLQQWLSRYGSCSMQNKSSNPSSHMFAPYDKDTNKGRAMESFHDSKKPILCLRCGYTGHQAGNCSSIQSNHPK